MPLRLLVVLAVLIGAAPALADSGADPEFRRWAVGYDFGISARYHFNEKWGIGARVNPDWDDESSTGQDFRADFLNGQEDSDSILFSETDSQRTGFSASLLVFRQSRVGRWLAIGPYAEMQYSWFRTQDVNERTRLDLPPGQTDWSGRDTDRRSYVTTVDIGVRPVFLLSERFVLESQLGLSARYSVSKNTWISENRRGPTDDLWISRETSVDDADSWTLGIVGERLGLGALLAFHVYL